MRNRRENKKLGVARYKGRGQDRGLGWRLTEREGERLVPSLGLVCGSGSSLMTCRSLCGAHLQMFSVQH